MNTDFPCEFLQTNSPSTYNKSSGKEKEKDEVNRQISLASLYYYEQQQPFKSSIIYCLFLFSHFYHAYECIISNPNFISAVLFVLIYRWLNWVIL